MDFPDYSIENDIMSYGYSNVVGVDEVGRGAATSNVVAAAVYIPPEALQGIIGKARDSKKLSEKKRNELCEVIRSTCVFGIGEVDAATIDKINILEATKIAMMQAIVRVEEKLNGVDFIVVDGTVDLSEHTDIPRLNIIKGDNKSVSIAAASIVAKVHRDRLMVELDKEIPLYNIKKNKGYLTADHIKALQLYGPTEHHRLSFNKVGK